MSAPLATRMAAGAYAVVLATEVADVLACSHERALLLMERVRPLATPGFRGVARYRLGDLVDADLAVPDRPRAPTSLPLAEVAPRRPRGRG